jgi:tripartite-type tricarboxylate transporter receptor subunit TctC
VKLRRRALLAGAAAIAVARPARAGRPIVLLVGAPAGSTADQIARAFAPFLERHLTRTRIAVANASADAGLAAYRVLAEADPSGDMLGWVATPGLAARMIDRAGGDLIERMTLLGALQKEPIAIVAPVASSIASVQDLFRRAAAETEAVPFATPPAGSPPHLAALRLQAVANRRLNIVAFPSASAARQAVVAGHVGAAALALSEAITPLREEKLVGLGIAAHERMGAFPDMAPLRDAGLPLFAFIRRGLALPRGAAEDVVLRYKQAMGEVIADPEFRDHAEATGFLPAWMEGAAWNTQIEAERDVLSRLWAEAPWRPTAGG